MSNEFEPEIYTLQDENGKEHIFEVLDCMEIDGERYFAFSPYFENPDDMLQDSCDIVILKSEIVDGEEMMCSIDNDEEYDKVGAIFMEKLSQELEAGFEELDELDEDNLKH